MFPLVSVLIFVCFWRENANSQISPKDFNLYTPNTSAHLTLLELERRRSEQAAMEAIKIKYRGRLQIYGGTNGHHVYLGCLNCPSNDPLSIWNNSGDFGMSSSKYSENIWNETSWYGGINNSYSPWSTSASNPPAIVDFDGTFYGYFTANPKKDKRIDSEFYNNLAENYVNTKKSYTEIGLIFK